MWYSKHSWETQSYLNISLQEKKTQKNKVLVKYLWLPETDTAKNPLLIHSWNSVWTKKNLIDMRKKHDSFSLDN